MAKRNDIYVNIDEEQTIKKKKKKKINVKKIMRNILLCILIFIFLFSVINLIRWAIYNKNADSMSKDLKQKYFSEDIDVENIRNDNDSNINKIFQNPIDFNELKKINEDVVGWIRIENTDIDYPILQSKDNEYYLHKDINRKYSTCGWIFMDCKNTNNFIDKNTVLYGHNIKSGIMFYDLQKVLNNKLGNKIIIEIFTPKEKLEYRVYSSYLEQPEEYAIKSNLVEESDVQDYIKEMLARSSIPYNIVPDKTDKLITLSTCDNSGKNRIIVHGVYVNGQTYENK